MGLVILALCTGIMDWKMCHLVS